MSIEDETGFGPSGAAEYNKFVDEYSIALKQASRAVAQLRKAEVVAPFDVQIAAGSLNVNRNNRFRHIGEIGTLLIGAGLAYACNVMFTSSWTFKNALIMFIPIIVGSILYTYTWRRD